MLVPFAHATPEHAREVIAEKRKRLKKRHRALKRT
jgi:hypothetical protein